MRHPLRAFLELTGPVLVGAFLVAAIWLNAPDELEIALPVGPSVDIEQVLRGKTLVRAVLSTLVVAVVLAYQLNRDYAKFFPTHLTFRIYFDERGMAASLQSFSERERNLLRVEEEWQPHHRLYLEKRINHLLESHGAPIYARITEKTVGHGSFDYNVRSVSGWQKYEMKEASGRVLFEFKGPRGSTRMWVNFELNPTDNDCIKGSFADVFFRHTKILQQCYTQEVQVGATKSYMVDDFLAPTKIRFFPWIGVSNTVYLVDESAIINDEDLDSGREYSRIPVGYAVYN